MTEEKYNEINKIGKIKGYKIVNIYTKKDNNKSRTYVDFICQKHIDKGIQTKKIEHFKKLKKSCCYCNHSKLKETFKEEMNEINPDIEILSEYKNWNTLISCKCKKCGYEWSGRVSVLLYGGGCKQCGYKKNWDSRGRKTTQTASEEIKKQNPNIEIIGEYTGSHNYIKCKCLIHNIEWESIFSHLRNGEATCPQCALEHAVKSYRLTTNEFIERIKEDYPHIIPLEDYTTRENEIRFHCSIHNIDFVSKPKSFLYKKTKGCPECQTSIGETKLLNLLGFPHNSDIIPQYSFTDCKYIKPLKFDAYDKKKNILYEFQGEQHYKPINFNGITSEESQSNFELSQLRDNIKRTYCKNNKIKLIEIPYWDIDNMEKYIQK